MFYNYRHKTSKEISSTYDLSSAYLTFMLTLQLIQYCLANGQVGSRLCDLFACFSCRFCNATFFKWHSTTSNWIMRRLTTKNESWLEHRQRLTNCHGSLHSSIIRLMARLRFSVREPWSPSSGSLHLPTASMGKFVLIFIPQLTQFRPLTSLGRPKVLFSFGIRTLDGWKLPPTGRSVSGTFTNRCVQGCQILKVWNLQCRSLCCLLGGVQFERLRVESKSHTGQRKLHRSCK